MVDLVLKSKIISAVKDYRRKFASDASCARSLEINVSAYANAINQGKERFLSDQMWMQIARQLSVISDPSEAFLTAQTGMFLFIKTQLQWCQAHSVSGMICDCCDVGKTHAARHYASGQKNTAYMQPKQG